MKQDLPYDSIPVAEHSSDESVLSSVMEAFKKLDRITGRDVSNRVTIEGMPFPWQRLEKPYDLEYYGVCVKWMRIFRNQFDGNAVRSIEEAVIDLQEEPLLISLNTRSEYLGHAVYAAYEACCVALLAQDERPCRYKHDFPFADTTEYISEACGIVREELLQYSFPNLESFPNYFDGEQNFVYWDKCRMDYLLYQFDNLDLRSVRKPLSEEYDLSSGIEAKNVILRAVEELKSLLPEPSSLCAVPFNDGFHGRVSRGYPRIRFACVEPQAFLQEFHPETDFNHAFRSSPLASEDPTGDANAEQLIPGDAPEQRRDYRSLLENVTLLTADEKNFARLLGMDITCLCNTEKRMMLAELVLTRTLAMLGSAVHCSTAEETELYRGIYNQLSSFYLSLQGKRNADGMFIEKGV